MNTLTQTQAVRVDSAALDSVAYDPETHILTLTFCGGGVYEYGDVPRTVYGELLRAESKGQFFAERIRDRFRYRRVGV